MSQSEQVSPLRRGKETVINFLNAFYLGDRDEAKRYLADDFSFRGPTASFSTAEEYLKSSEHAKRLLRGIEIHKVFAEDEDVCVFYALRINHPVNSVSVAEWYRLSGNKISSIRMIFDTAPFVDKVNSQPSETAVDPVCHMSVQKNSAAASRVYQNNIYYFCSVICADEFAREPEKYLSAQS